MAAGRWSIASALCGVLLLAGSAQADTKDTNSIQGLVINKAGKPVAGAEVKAQRKDSTAPPVVTKTDERGLYAFTSLPAGKYSVTVVADNGAKAPPIVANVGSTADDGRPVRRFISPLPYQVRPDYRSGTPVNVRRRYVWKDSETGSHIGGRWVPVSDADGPSGNPLEVLGGADLGHSPALRLNSAAK